MADTRTLLEAITDNGDTGKKVRVEVADRNEYETLRTRLVKLWAEQRDIILAVDEDDHLAALSLCADFHDTGSDSELCAATFWLGKSRRKQAKSYSFSIIPPADSDAMSEALPSVEQEEPDETTILPIKRPAT